MATPAELSPRQRQILDFVEHPRRDGQLVAPTGEFVDPLE
jgi:hypothetical protein